MPSTVTDAAPEDTADDAAASSAPAGTDTEAPTAETAAESAAETQESAPVAAEDDTPPENPVEKYGRPWSNAVGYDKLHFYDPTDLVATRMYFRPAVLPIALICMGYGVPGFPTELSDDEIISKTLNKGKGQLFTPVQLVPTNTTTGKKYLQKELIRRFMVDDVDFVDITKIPRCRNYTINQLIQLLIASPPPAREHGFILRMLDHLREEVESHFSGHSGSRVAALNRHMRFIEVIVHPDLARDWKERNMQKNRPHQEGAHNCFPANHGLINGNMGSKGAIAPHFPRKRSEWRTFSPQIVQVAHCAPYRRA
ncbi:hypothetical protein ACHAWO_007860 [Cyclotella atomus]|uniref:Uncharacterized protein n=1 Tax=Cyclotella atomus TaxID=382360 RepID=A0ABD3NSY4_9STRA